MSDRWAEELQALLERWAAGLAWQRHAVDLGVDALVRGLDSPGLRELAGATESTPAHEMEPLLAAVAEEFRVAFYPRGEEAGLRARAYREAEQLLTGSTTPRQFAAFVHSTLGHGWEDEVESLVRLDDEYDIAEFTGRSSRDIDADVMAAARAFVMSRPAVQ